MLPAQDETFNGFPKKSLSWLTMITVCVENIPQIAIQVANAIANKQLSFITVLSVTVSMIAVLVKTVKLVFLTTFSGFDDYAEPKKPETPSERDQKRSVISDRSSASDVTQKKADSPARDDDCKVAIPTRAPAMADASTNRAEEVTSTSDVNLNFVTAGKRIAVAAAGVAAASKLALT